MIKGSCLCGQIKYSVHGSINLITHCHCQTCRKAHGSAFSTVGQVKISDFVINSGNKLLKSFESSPNKNRYFCSICGSQIYAHRIGKKDYILRLGTLDDDPINRPISHIWISNKASWYEIDKKLPQFETMP